MTTPRKQKPKQKHHSWKRFKNIRTTVLISLSVLFLVLVCAVPRQVEAADDAGFSGSGSPSIFQETFDNITTLTVDVPEAGLPTASIGEKIRAVVDKIGESLIHMATSGAKIAIKNGLRTFLTRVAYDTAIWIATGNHNQGALIEERGWGAYFEDVGDAAIGDALQTLASEGGYLKFNLCDPYDLSFALKLQIGLEFALTGPRQPECTFTEMRKSWSQAIEDPEFLNNFSASWSLEQNEVGAFLSLQQTILQQEAQAQQLALLERESNEGYKPVTDQISGFIETPAPLVKKTGETALDQAFREVTDFVDDPIADAINVFSSTLVSKLLDNVKGGFYSLADLKRQEAQLTGCGLFNNTCAKNSAAAGVAAAKAKFASLSKPTFNTGEEFSVLNELVSCSRNLVGPTNCVIDENFRIAVQDKLTVGQALSPEHGLLDGNKPFAYNNGADILDTEQGYGARAITILKNYSVVPVGWQIAAEYIKQHPGTYTLNQIVADFNRCGTDADYSPFCGLIDPDWVLKAPANFCRREGPGGLKLTEQFADLDGVKESPKATLVARQTVCSDPQTCIQENPDGTCARYGYCTEQANVWKFSGQQCSEQFNTCTQLTNAQTGATDAYLLNTVNKNGCGPDNAGCQWYCSVYNQVDQDWQCTAEGRFIPRTCPEADGCQAREQREFGDISCGTDPCDIASGGFSCTNSSGKKCYYAEPVDASPSNLATVNLDAAAENCDANDAGCTQFVYTDQGSNLIANASFEQFGGTANDDTEDKFGVCDGTDGFTQACSADGECGAGQCIGWHSGTASAMYAVTSPTIIDVPGQDIAMQLESSNGDYIYQEFESNAPLKDRSFILSANYKLEGADCNILVDFTTPSQTSGNDYVSRTRWELHNTGTWNRLFHPGVFQNTPDGTGGSVLSVPYTWPSNTTETAFRVRIEAGVCTQAGSKLFFDGIQLEETKPATFEQGRNIADYTNYGVKTLHLTDKRLQCSFDDVGCEIYTAANTNSGTAAKIPGVVTNPLSSSCSTDGGATKDYANPSCSQCDAEFVGCDTYEEQSLTNNPPDPTFKDRTGFYCSGDQSKTCVDAVDAAGDCAGIGSCIPDISIVPTTGKTCSAQYVGCEQYTNLDEVAAGGEGIEYYTRIKQCVKPHAGDDTQGVFYSYVGSDRAGYQLISHRLKVSNLTSYNGETGQAPCTNLDYTSESDNPDCKDDDQGAPAVCSEANIRPKNADGTFNFDYNPDCTQYFTAGGDYFYRLRSHVITISDSCHPLRNTNDSRVYHAIREESQTCPADMNQCREYKGNAGNNVRIVLNDDLDEKVWSANQPEDREPTADTISGTGQAMKIAADKAVWTTDGNFGLTEITPNNAYILSFWAKPAANSSLQASFQGSANPGDAIYFEPVNFTVADEWNFYRVGPVIFNRGVEGDEKLVFKLSGGGDVIVDNVKVTNSDSQFLIKGTSKLCKGFEGCLEYRDRAGKDAYLKSFDHLCKEEFAGCKALIDTQNSSDTAYAESFNMDNVDALGNPETSDDTVIKSDTVVALVDNPKAYCNSSEKACQALGVPTLNNQIDNEDQRVVKFDTVYKKNDPDKYETILCSDHELMCRKYDAGESTYYFKDPTNKLCEFRESSGESSTGGWYIKDTDTPCKLSNPTNLLSHPANAICASGDRKDEFCQLDSECPGSYCSSVENNDTGWVGSCPADQNSCTLYLDPYGKSFTSNEFTNTGFETDSKDNTTNTIPEDGKPDDWEVTNCNDDAGKYYANEGHTGDRSFAAEGSCEITHKNIVEVDTSDVYTVRAYVKLDGGDISRTHALAFGLEFYDIQGNQIIINDCGSLPNEICPVSPGGTVYWVAAPPTINNVGDWVMFQGTIGAGQLVGFPEGTAGVKLISNSDGNDNRLLIDDFTFSHNDEYYYLGQSVDSSSCNGIVDPKEGCIAFNDVRNSLLTTRTDDPTTEVNEQNEFVLGSNSDVTPVSCTINAINPENAKQLSDQDCRAIANAADSNQVIKVNRDRECSEWLACRSSITDVDENDNEIAVCNDIGRCRELTPSGACAKFLSDPDAQFIGSFDDYTFTSTSGDTEEVKQLKNKTGYIKAGISSSHYATDAIKGYYSYAIAPQVGKSGGVSTQEIIPNGTLDDTQCNQGNVGAACTQNWQCKPAGFDQLPDEQKGEYSCNNSVVARGWHSNPTGISADDTTLRIIDFYENINSAEGDQCNNADQEGIPENPSICLDLNNVLKISPQGGTENGAAVNLGKKIIPNGEYVLSFDAQYIGIPGGETDAVKIGFQHNDDPNNFDEFSKTCIGGVRDGLFCSNAAGDCRSITTNEIIDAGGCGDPETLASLGLQALCTDPDSDGNVDGYCDYSTSCPGTGSLLDNPPSYQESTCKDGGIRFDDTLKKYTLGPLTVQDGSFDKTALVFNQTDGSGGTPFVIDNVSLKPALEVNIDLPLISRECRSFPQSDSPSCEYTDTNGIKQAGWRGYCMEPDPINPEQCLQWLPLDVIVGEPNVFTRAQKPAGYNDRANLWMCLVSKGNLGEDRKVCISDDPNSKIIGKFCSGDGDCPGGKCFDQSGTFGGESNYKNTIGEFDVEKTNVCMYNVGATGSEANNDFVGAPNQYKQYSAPTYACHQSSGDDCKNKCKNSSGKFRNEFPDGDEGRLYNWPVKDVWKTIDMDEVEALTVHLGDVADEEKRWFPFINQKTRPDRDVVFTKNMPIVKDCRDPGGAGIYEDPYPCWWYGQVEDEDGFKYDGDSGSDFMFVLGSDDTADNIFEGNNKSDPNPNAEPSNPFTWADGGAVTIPKRDLPNRDPNKQFPPRNDDGNNPVNRWDSDGDGDTELVPQEGVAWFRHADDEGVAEGKEKNYYEDDGNVYAIWLDFDNTGHLANVWQILFHANKGFGDMQNIRIQPHLREQCEYLVQTVQEDGTNRAWTERVKPVKDGGFTVKNVFHTFFSDLSPFGGAVPPNDQLPYLNPGGWDTRDDGLTLEEGNQPLYAERPDTVTTTQSAKDAPYQARSGTPYACVGACRVSVCDAGPKLNRTCLTDEDCSINREEAKPYTDDEGNEITAHCIGVSGVCVDDDDNQSQATICNRDDQCGTGQHCKQGADRDGVVTHGGELNNLNPASSTNSYAEQVGATAQVGATTLKHVFAEIYDAAQYDRVAKRYVHKDPRDAFAYPGDPTFTWFEAMPICTGPDNTRPAGNGENTFCGVRPTISNFKINKQPETAGARINVTDTTGTAVLEFDAKIDPNQLPLQTILIDWDDGTEPVPIEWGKRVISPQAFTHQYTCNIADGDSVGRYVTGGDDAEYIDDCQYNPKIRLIDNWLWCSGTELGDDSREGPDPADSGSCTTWDVFGTENGNDANLGIVIVPQQ